MSLAPYVRILGRGPGRSRSLTREEAREAMALILSGEAAPEAIGALLMLMRFRGETAGEVAGFVEAARDMLPPWPGATPMLDWPSYAAGRTRGLPWFLLSARLVARAGAPVLLHGWNSHQRAAASVRSALPAAGIAEAASMEQAADLIAREGIAYLPLEAFAPRLLELLRLRDVLGLRSAVNTVLRVLNPSRAPAAVQGVFHPPYRELQADACDLLGQPAMTVLKGGGGEFERHPSKDIALYGTRNGTRWEASAAALEDDHRRLADAAPDPDDLARLWTGELDDPFASAIVLGTAELALETCGLPAAMAQDLWTNRNTARAA
ncbi:glycosyl transferase family protein [Oceanicola sp. 502str15]|uniref:glycosyl transferase family protein n=1 Tax=Oceanicola sp. 502str15 TaxID=2696061 RepID=UPI0020949AEF|nr:glycosyl transferase family protein [Oceanicola sp. 502str15]MCO6381138.1 glycosyl transferase family protein [Oceanicola sp. 502str15]